MTAHARLAALSLLVLCAAACGRSESPAAAASASGRGGKKALDVVTMNFTTSSLSSAPLVIAREEGFFAAEGIDARLELVDSNASLLALSQGRIDVLSGPVRSGLFNLMLKGVAVQIVADRGHSEPGCSSESFAAPIATADRVAKRGFRGERLMLIRGGLTEYVIDRLLEKNGLTRDDVELAQVVPQGDQASRRIDAIRLMQEPNLSNVKVKGLMREVATMEEVAPGHQFSVIAFGPRLLRKDPALGRRFMRAYLRGVARYREGKTERNVEILSRLTELPPEIIRRACWQPIAADARINTKSTELFLEWAKKKGYLDGDVPVSLWWNPGFIDAALAGRAETGGDPTAANR